MPKVKGTINANPVDAESPGITPTNIPIVIPIIMAAPGCHQGIVSVPNKAEKPDKRFVNNSIRIVFLGGEVLEGFYKKYHT
jgi:amino acid permease